MNKMHKKALIEDKEGWDGFQTSNAGRAGAHPAPRARITAASGWSH